ncbi:MAG: hypothetical protein KAT68_14975 [Bacteroidales bacterium]|nr:hypothetical protein [Bacteroidales bacterium]
MNDKLEKFILENKEHFNIYEPAPDVWNKIKLKDKNINWTSIIWKAAAVVIIFFSAFFMQEYRYNINDNISDNIENYDVNLKSELTETEAYYAHQVSVRMKEVKKLMINDPEAEKELNYDILELDSIYNELKNDLKDNVANDEVIEAMIQNYRLKLKILEDILKELQETDTQELNNINNKEYEI